MLSNLRGGVTMAQDEAFWVPQYYLFDINRVNAMCFNRDRGDINHTYVIRAHEVVTVRADCRGVHATANAHAKGGQALRIQRNAYFLTDMLVSFS